jgi:O-antigen ligase
MAVNLVWPISVALLLAGQGGRLAAASVLAAAVCVVLSLSRGSLAMFIGAMAFVFLGSLVRRMTSRKVWVALALAAGGVVFIAKSYDTIIERFLTAPEASVRARDRFKAAAAAMLREHPTGIGINQFSYVLKNEGYADELDMPEMDRDGLAHHIYWLTLAEMGWAGLLAYLLLIVRPLWDALRGALRRGNGIRGDVLLGCAAGMTVMAIHGTAEWVARQTRVTYLFWIVVGLTAALYRQVTRMREDGRLP